MSTQADADALLHQLSEPWGEPSDPAALTSFIEARLAEVREALPTVAVDITALGDALVRALASMDDPWARVQRVRWTDLALAAQSLLGSAAALRVFEQRYFSRVEAQIERHLRSKADRDEVAQTVREKVLMQADRTLEYAAQGTLGALTNLIAVRSAIDHHRGARARPDRTPSADSQIVDTLMDAGLTPELLAARERHRSTFKAAFVAALGALSPQDRGLLRLSLLQRLSVSAVAALLDVHRATAARRLARVRDKLAEHVRRELRFGAGLSESELRSLHHALDSQLELSLSRLLIPEDGDADD